MYSLIPLLCAQPGTIGSSSSLSFPITSELDTSFQSITITNTTAKDFEITDIRFYNTYGQPAFSVANDSSFTIMAGDSQTVAVRFHPRHNINHNSEMVLLTNSGMGSFFVNLAAQGTYSKAYYSTTENKSEAILRTALKTKISQGYNSLGYNTARDNMYMTIDNQKTNGQGTTVNTLECVYTGRLCTNYASRTAAQNSCNFNTEHTFPQGFFSSNEPMKSDIHHLYTTDNPANGSRANLPFGIATTPYQSPSINAPSLKGSNGVYEPRTEQKGPSARAMMYFVVRHQDYSNFFDPQETRLRLWNDVYIPTAAEQKRNDDIFDLQNNRNPFIDYPQFAERITKLVGTTVAPCRIFLRPDRNNIDFDDVPANTDIIYNYVLVNNGNQDVTLSNFALGNTDLSFDAGDSNVDPCPRRSTYYKE